MGWAWANPSLRVAPPLFRLKSQLHTSSTWVIDLNIKSNIISAPFHLVCIFIFRTYSICLPNETCIDITILFPNHLRERKSPPHHIDGGRYNHPIASDINAQSSNIEFVGTKLGMILILCTKFNLFAMKKHKQKMCSYMHLEIANPCRT